MRRLAFALLLLTACSRHAASPAREAAPFSTSVQPSSPPSPLPVAPSRPSRSYDRPWSSVTTLPAPKPPKPKPVAKKPAPVTKKVAAQVRVQRPATTYKKATVDVQPTGVWDRLAQCESDGRWDYNGSSGFDGGLQFHPKTWAAYRPAGYPRYAYQATRLQQIAVARLVLAAETWRAWPACSRKLGLR